MSADPIAGRLAFAIGLAVECGALAQRMRHGLGKPDAKNPIDFCTEADRAVEALIRARVAAAFGDAVIGEEEGGEAADSVWVVDPIDGTAGYIHGTPRWCVSLSYVRDGRTQVGVIFAPDTDRLFAARRGGGATLNGRPISVSHLRHGAAPVIELGWSARRGLEEFCALLHRLTEAGIEFRRHGSGALGLAEAAAGLSDGYVELHMNAWDCLAGMLLVEEAGGRVNDVLAGEGLTEGNLVLAATPEVAPRLAEILGTTLVGAVSAPA